MIDWLAAHPLTTLALVVVVVSGLVGMAIELITRRWERDGHDGL